MNDSNTSSPAQAIETFGAATDFLEILSILCKPLTGEAGQYFDVLGKVNEYLAHGKDAANVATSNEMEREIFGIIGEAIGGGIGGAAGGALVGGGSALVLGNDGDVFAAILGLFVGGAIGSAGGLYIGKEFGKEEMQNFYDYLKNLPKYQQLTDAQRQERARLIKAGILEAGLYGPDGPPKVGDPLYDLYKATRDWWKHELGHISDTVNDWWEQARNWIARYDPLVLDLDGDGIETVGVNATTHILFDHNNDGIKTGTGWVNGDDGLLVLDRNGNGIIDNGSELFGDGTMVNGVKATDGFSALGAENTNKNTTFDAGDANFKNVRVWQDTNQDGISQTSELHTLSALGIKSINLASTDTGGYGLEESAKKSWIQGHRCYRTLMPRSKLKMIRNYHFLRFTPFAGMTNSLTNSRH